MMQVAAAAIGHNVGRRALLLLPARNGLRMLSSTQSQQQFDFDFDTIVDRTNTESMKWGRYSGKEVIPLWVADMDFKCAPCIVEALEDRISHGIYGYGLPPASLIKAVVAYLDRLGFTSQPGSSVSERDLIFLPNIISGLGLTCCAFAEEGQSIMTTTPIYPPFLTKPKAKRRNVIDVPLKHLEQSGSWTLDLEAMEAAVTPCTKVFMLCNPHNPVGHVYSRAELESLNAFCAKHDIIVCADEVHCDLVFPDSPRPHVPFASISTDAADRCVSVYAANKAYNVPALGCSYAVVTNASLRTKFSRAFAADYSRVDPGILGYTAMEAAYSDEGGQWLEQLLVYLQDNRDFVHSFIQEHMAPEHVKVFARPDATYMTWIDASGLGLENPQKHFEEHGVAFTGGAPFGGPLHPDYDGYVRINFGCPRSTLEEGLQRMLNGYNAALAKM